MRSCVSLCRRGVRARPSPTKWKKPSRRGTPRAGDDDEDATDERENDDDKRYARWFAFVTFIHTQRYDVRALEASGAHSSARGRPRRREGEPNSLAASIFAHLVHARAELILEHALRRAFGPSSLERRDAGSKRAHFVVVAVILALDGTGMPPVYARG